METLTLDTGEKKTGNRLFVLIGITGAVLISLLVFWLLSGGPSHNLAERRLISALSFYRESKWGFKNAFAAVYGENEEIDLSEITNAGNKDDVDDNANYIIELFSTRSKRIEEERQKVEKEARAAERIERSINDGLTAKQKKLASSLVKNIKIFNGLESDLIDVYDDYTDSKIMLAKNTKKLALNELGVDKYNEFNKKRNDLIEDLSVREKDVIKDLKEYGMRIDDDLYRLLLELE